MFKQANSNLRARLDYSERVQQRYKNAGREQRRLEELEHKLLISNIELNELIEKL